MSFSGFVSIFEQLISHTYTQRDDKALEMGKFLVDWEGRAASHCLLWQALSKLCLNMYVSSNGLLAVAMYFALAMGVRVCVVYPHTRMHNMYRLMLKHFAHLK